MASPDALRFYFASRRQDEATPAPPAQLLGHIAWLWSLSPLHAEWPCHLLRSQVLPALKQRQCVLVGNGAHPVAYAAWAWLSDEAQARYLQNPNALDVADWRSGPHLWWIDWVAPFGHTKAMAAHFKAHVFPRHTGRALRVKPGARVARVVDFHGDQVAWMQRREQRSQFSAQFEALAGAHP